MTAYERPTDSLPISRRTVIMNTGLAAAAIAGLSSCTVYGSAPAAQPTSAGASSGQASSASGGSQGLTVKAADIPVGSGKIFADTKTVVTQPTAGTFKAFDAVCPHEGCTVASFEGSRIVCPCHQSHFDSTTGDRVSGPAQTGLAPKTITVTGDIFTVG